MQEETGDPGKLNILELIHLATIIWPDKIVPSANHPPNGEPSSLDESLSRLFSQRRPFLGEWQ
jgi:hypothetical protein